MPGADRNPGSPWLPRARRIDASARELAAATEELTLLSIGSIAPGIELTLLEYCALSTVATGGSHSLRRLAGVLDTPVTTISAVGQRLVVIGLGVLTSSGAARDRRLVASTAGRALVDDVTRRRRRAIAETLGQLDPTARRTIADNLRRFGELASPQVARPGLESHGRGEVRPSRSSS